MDKKQIAQKLDEFERMATEVSCLIETTANSCERNGYTEQEIPLRIAQTKQDELLDQIRDTNIELYV